MKAKSLVTHGNNENRRVAAAKAFQEGFGAARAGEGGRLRDEACRAPCAVETLDPRQRSNAFGVVAATGKQRMAPFSEGAINEAGSVAWGGLS